EVAAYRRNLVAVAHPDGGFGRDALEQPGGLVDSARRPAEFARLPRLHLAAEDVAGELHAVADAEDRDVQVEDRGVAARSIGLVDARRSAGEDDALRLQLGDTGGRQVVAHHLAEDVQLAHAPGDELRV